MDKERQTLVQVTIGRQKINIMWISNQLSPPLVILTTLLFGGMTSALDTGNKVPSDVVQILPKDAISSAKKLPLLGHDEKDLKTDATVTHNSEPAPEFYRGVSASDSIRDRAYDRYGTGSSGWTSLDKDSLYKNPYIANAYNKLTNGGSTSSPSVSSLASPNSSYRDRYGE